MMTSGAIVLLDDLSSPYRPGYRAQGPFGYIKTGLNAAFYRFERKENWKVACKAKFRPQGTNLPSVLTANSIVP